MTPKKIVEVEKPLKPNLRHARFYVHGGDYNPIGYRCGDIEIKRKRGESTEELRTRCRDSIEWADADTQHVFIPLR